MLAAPEGRPVLLVVTNVPTPYRIAFFNVLHAAAAAREIAVQVLYCALREPHRHWTVELGSQQYPWKVLRGLHPRVGSAVAHINPGAPRSVLRANPRWAILAGAWNTPTVLLVNWVLRGRAARIFWSEGHHDAVQHPRGPIARLRRAALTSFDGFAVPNERSEQFIRDQIGGAKPFLRLPNSVDEEFFGAAAVLRESAEQVRKKYGLPVAKRVVLSVAQLTERKGVDLLLAAYATLDAATRRMLTLALVGSGPAEQRLRSAAAAIPGGEALFLGERRPEEVRELLAATDAFALASRSDPNPLAPIEAALAGSPVILSRRAGNSAEIVEPGTTGFVVDPDSIPTIARALSDVVNASKETLAEMGHAGRSHAFARFGRRSIADSLLDQLTLHFPQRLPAG